jgi:hypothetical protein
MDLMQLKNQRVEIELRKARDASPFEAFVTGDGQAREYRIEHC